MRISDWSSDVCSSDLFAPRGTPFVAVVSGTVVQTTGRIGGKQVKLAGDDGVSYYGTHLDGFGASGRVNAGDVIGYVGTTGHAAGGTPPVDRTSVVEGKSVAVRVDLGGRRFIQNTHRSIHTHNTET